MTTMSLSLPRFGHVLVATALLTSVVGCTRRTPDRATPPNVLLVTLDTTRADYIGCYGNRDMQTPTLDRLAEEGARFSRAVATSQGTNPAHASIHTGLYVSRHRVINNRTWLADDAVTLAEVLSEHGYSTLAAVSVRHIDAPNTQFDQGFQTFLHCEDAEIRAEDRNDDQLLSQLGKLARKHDPFFAWVHYYDPHGAYRPPEPFSEMYPVERQFDPIASNEFMDIDRHYKEEPTFDPDTQISLYKGEISYVDSQLAVLMETLLVAGALDDTIVVVVGDHGESMTEHGVYFCHRGLYNPSVHVPLLIRYPQKVTGGTVVEQLVSGVDIHPTVLDLAGIDASGQDIDGLSLVPALSTDSSSIHDAVFSESIGGAGKALFAGEDKFIKQYGNDPFISGKHLYRAWSDYGETANLYDSQPDRSRELEDALEVWYGANKQRQLDSHEPATIDPKTEEALRALGYVD